MVNWTLIALGVLMVPVLLFIGALLIIANVWRKTDESQE